MQKYTNTQILKDSLIPARSADCVSANMQIWVNGEVRDHRMMRSRKIIFTNLNDLYNMPTCHGTSDDDREDSLALFSQNLQIFNQVIFPNNVR